MWELALAILTGLVGGIVTGLLPGIHINLVAPLLLLILGVVPEMEPLTLVCAITALAVTHVIIDIIPSVYTGAPSEETALSVLPAHQLLRKGRGHEAVLIAMAGSLCGMVILIPAIPVFATLVPLIEPKIEGIIPFALIAIALFMILREDTPLPALVCFVLAGFLGYNAFNTEINQPLFPLLSGLFGISGLIVSASEKEKLLEQKKIKIREVKITKKDGLKTMRDILCIGIPCSILPALGSGYAALIASEKESMSPRRFLMMSSGMNIFTLGASFLLLYEVGKARTGAAALVRELLTPFEVKHMILIIACMFFVALIACVIGKMISERCATIIQRVRYDKLAWCTIVFIVIIVAFVSRGRGILLLATGAALGVYAIQRGVKRMHLMGALIVPTIIYYLMS